MKNKILFYLLLTHMHIAAAQQLVQYRACTSCDTHGQNNSGATYQYGAVTEYKAIGVADDYGVRIDGDKWHGGVDYNSQATGEDGAGDRGDLIIAIEGGTIRGVLDAGYKRLFVQGAHHFGYGHMFWGSQDNTQSGGCYLRRIIQSTDDWAIVLVVDGDTTAIGPDAGEVVFAGDTLTVRTTIAAGEPIGPTGGSSDGLELGPHLHLYSNPAGNTSVNDEVPKNPLQYVHYSDTTFQVKILKENDTDEGITLVYPGTSSSTVQVRPRLSGQPTGVNRYPKILDLDQVQIYIQNNSNAPYQLIKGASFESNLCLGGRIGGPPRYPRNADGSGNSPWYNEESEWNRTGIHPYAYRAGSKANPWDDHYFADFITRIHKDDPMDGDPAMIADCPSQARYNDGLKKIKAVVTDARGDESEGPKDISGALTPIEFILDNFKPFVQDVIVKVGAKEVYRARWNCGGGCNGLIFERDSIAESVNYSELAQGLDIWVTTSEPLLWLQLDVDTFYSHRSTTWNVAGNTGWFFHIPDGSWLSTGIDITFSFTGADLKGNSLLNLTSRRDDCSRVPVRTGSSSWSNPDNIAYGTDDTHVLYLECGAGGRPLAGSIFIHEEHCFESRFVNGVKIPGLYWAITPATNHSADDGSISVVPGGGRPPYILQWDDGDTSLYRTNLSPGTYCFTINDAMCCEKDTCLTLNYICEEITLQGTVIEYPGSCYSNDGKIHPGYLDIDGGISPYTYNWSNGETGYFIDSLYPGVYTVAITDSYGCSGIFEFDLPSINEPEIIHAYINACEGEDNGGLLVIADGDEPNGYTGGPYNFYWSSGLTTSYSYSSFLSNVLAGTYSVTVVDVNGLCTVADTFEIEEIPDEGTFSVNIDVEKSCIDASTGSISAVASGGNPPYTYEWDNGAETPSLSDLPAGFYYLTVTDKCQRIIVRPVQVEAYPPMEVNYSVSGCPGSGVLDIEVTGGVAPYSYTWPAGQTTQDINNLNSGLYRVTVTDSKGCVKTRSFIVGLGQVFLDDEEPPCEGFHDGEITLRIHKPSYDTDLAISAVLLNGIPMTLPPVQSNPTYLPLSSLSAGETYSVHVEMGNCTYDTSFILSNKPLERVFNTLVSGHCFYDEYCDGELIQELSYSNPSTLNFGDTRGDEWLQGCKIAEDCWNYEINSWERIRWKKYDKRTVKVGEYREILTQMLFNSPFQYDYIAGLLGDVLPLPVCARVRFCPANMGISSIYRPFGTGGDMVSIGDDCFHIECDWPTGDENFCVSSSLPDYVNPPDDPPFDFENCNPQSYNVYQLLLWYDNLEELPGFEISTLRVFLDGVLSNPDYYEKAPCSHVTFCLSDLSFINTDISTTLCEPPAGDTCLHSPTADYCEVQTHFISETNEEVSFVNCLPTYNDDGPNEEAVLFCTPDLVLFYEGFPGLSFAPEDEEWLYKITPENSPETEFGSLGIAKSEGHLLPKGIYKSEGVHLYDDYVFSRTTDKKFTLPPVEFLIDDADAETIIFLEKPNPVKGIVNYIDTLISWGAEFSTSGSLKFMHLTHENNLIHVGGHFVGTLTVGSQTVGQSSSPVVFLLTFNEQGDRVGTVTINGANAEQNIAFASSQNEANIFVVASGAQLTANGSFYSSNPGQLMNIRITNEGTVTFNRLAQLSGNVQLVDFSSSQDNSYTTYVFKGGGTISGDFTIQPENSTDITFITLNSNGTKKWSKIINCPGFDSNYFDLTYGNDHSLYAGLTFEGQLGNIGTEVTSVGGKDIAFILFDSLGNIINTDHYGSTDNENVSRLLYDNNGVLYFGGEFYGGTTTRTIGKHIFINFSATERNAYTSFILDPGSQALSQPPKGLASDMANQGATVDVPLHVYPNPFNNEVFVEFYCPVEIAYTIEIFNSLGANVFKSDFAGFTGKNRVKIDLSDKYGSGMFAVKVTTANGDTWNNKILKTQK